MTPLLTAAQAADLLQVTRHWLERQCATRRITAFTMLGNRYRFTEADLEQIVEQYRPTIPGRATPLHGRRVAGRPPSSTQGRPARGRAS